MKTIKLIAALAVMAVASVRADEDPSKIYWMVENAEYDSSLPDIGGSAIYFLYATITAKTSTGDLDIGGAVAEEFPTQASSLAEPVYSGIFDSSAVESFFVQLYDDSGTRVAWQTYSMADVVAANSIWHINGPSMGTGATPYVMSSFIPEPTSGLLLLFGVAGLALRRRKMNKGDLL